MPRGAAGGVAAFALTATVACDNGGFDATTWNLALVALCGAALVLVIVGGAARPSAPAWVLLGALALLTAWTAASYLWSMSPPLAPVEAQRTALYFVVALVAVLARPWLEPRWVAAGIAGAATLVAIWNIIVRIRGVANPDISGLPARPVGYANSLALLCALGLVLLLCLPRPALAAAPVLLADFVWQRSAGAAAALAAAVLVFLFVTHPRRRAVLAVVAVAAAVALPFAFAGNVRSAYWRVAVRESEAHPVAGSGAGTYADWWLRERRVPYSTKEAHSLYLETLAELGPLGLALVLTVFAVPIVAAGRARKPVLAAAVAAYAAGAAVDFHWELPAVTVPAILVAAVALPRGRRAVPLGVAVPVLAVLVAAGVLAYAGNARLADAQAALQGNDKPAAAAAARAALRFAPYSAEAWQVIGDAESSAAAYRRGLALDPHDWALWSRLASVSRGAERRRAIREAALLDPFGPASGP